jgi:cysteinyl-tRNA synthetase
MNLELMNSGKYNPASAFQPDQALYFLFHEFLSSRFKFLDFFAPWRLGVKNFLSAGTLKFSWRKARATGISFTLAAGFFMLAASAGPRRVAPCRHDPCRISLTLAATMTIQIYNTQTRRKEPFAPLNPPVVTIYNCGPTIYDHFHIGNARNFVFMDMARRWLERRGFQVRFVQNLTDIDDKIIKKANDEGITADDVTAKFIPLYFEDADKLRVRRATVHPRATEHIPDILALIQKLVDKGLAYPASGTVWYSVRKFAGYGKLSGRRLEDLLEGARVEATGEKAEPGDFALWKAAKPGEPAWDSPWGPGRPGWHIECSAMAMKCLGETIDIHAGGSDLIFPHHENEIAQSEGATGRPFCRFWMHNGFLNIDSQKMSKSLGNFLKIDQVLQRAPVEAVRHFLLSAHYRSPLDLTETALEESASATRRVNDAIETAQKVLALEGIGEGGTAKPAKSKRTKETEETEETRDLLKRFEEAMDDDFNTPKALAVLFESVSLIHEARQAKPMDPARLMALVAFARGLRDFFSLEPSTAAASAASGATDAGATESGDDSLAPKLIELLIETRQMARKAKAFAIADRVRDGLAERGIALEDHPQGTIWKRKEG